jgi:hypothetical protein
MATFLLRLATRVRQLSNAMNEEPYQGKLHGFANADLIRWRRTQFNFAQASSYRFRTGTPKNRKGG